MNTNAKNPLLAQWVIYSFTDSNNLARSLSLGAPSYPLKVVAITVVAVVSVAAVRVVATSYLRLATKIRLTVRS